MLKRATVKINVLSKKYVHTVCKVKLLSEVKSYCNLDECNKWNKQMNNKRKQKYPKVVNFQIIIIFYICTVPLNIVVVTAEQVAPLAGWSVIYVRTSRRPGHSRQKSWVESGRKKEQVKVIFESFMFFSCFRFLDGYFVHCCCRVTGFCLVLFYEDLARFFSWDRQSGASTGSCGKKMASHP